MGNASGLFGAQHLANSQLTFVLELYFDGVPNISEGDYKYFRLKPKYFVRGTEYLGDQIFAIGPLYAIFISLQLYYSLVSNLARFLQSLTWMWLTDTN